jgi:hypothetical protein
MIGSALPRAFSLGLAWMFERLEAVGFPAEADFLAVWTKQLGVSPCVR